MAILVDWAKQTVSGTPGTGTITLSTAVTGFIRLQDDTRLTDGATVYYTIEDGSNFERGIGTYTATGTTLARTLIQAKYESGTYTESPGTGLTLTSAAIVSCSAVAATHNFRGALVYHDTTQAITTNIATYANFNSEVYDTHGFHDTVTNNSRLTIPSGLGIRKVKLYAGVSYAFNTTGLRYTLFHKNAAQFYGGGGQVSLPVTTSGWPLRKNLVTPTISCTDGDYFNLSCYQNSGGNLNISEGGTSAELHYFGIEVIE